MAKINFFQGQSDLLSFIKEDDILTTEDLKIKEIQKRIMEFFNVKNIHFLFGSGTSCKAIPNMKGLYMAVYNEVVESGGAKMKEFDAIAERIDNNENLEEILGILYSRRIYLNKYEKYKKNLTNCNDLIKIIEDTIFNKINISFNSSDAKKVLLIYQDFYSKLALRNKDLSRLNIFTTNNDLFNETALDSLNIHYINGFGGGINKFFNPALFNYTFSKRMDTSIEKFEPVENMVYLYKLHGSINWIEDSSNSNTFFKIREVSYPEKLKESERNILIYPTPTKQNKSLGSPYVELFREFQKKLLEPNSILFVIGYSFSDEHVNNIIYQALATNSTMNVVILNDVEHSSISKINDNRIFRIWETIEDEEWDAGTEPIHFFKNIVNKLLPNIDAYKNQDKTLKDFIEFYNDNISKQ